MGRKIDSRQFDIVRKVAMSCRNENLAVSSNEIGRRVKNDRGLTVKSPSAELYHIMRQDRHLHRKKRPGFGNTFFYWYDPKKTNEVFNAMRSRKLKTLPNLEEVASPPTLPLPHEVQINLPIEHAQETAVRLSIAIGGEEYRISLSEARKLQIQLKSFFEEANSAGVA